MTPAASPASIELAAMFDEPPGRSWSALAIYLLNIYVVAEAIRAISRYLDRSRRLVTRRRVALGDQHHRIVVVDQTVDRIAGRHARAIGAQRSQIDHHRVLRR